MKDYYLILGIKINATSDDIKKAYRSLSKKFHPDINPKGAEQFKNINEANNTLSDSQKRIAYDLKYKSHFGQNQNNNQNNKQTGSNASQPKTNANTKSNVKAKKDFTNFTNTFTSNNGSHSTITVNGVKINVNGGKNVTTNIRVVNGQVIIETTTN